MLQNLNKQLAEKNYLKVNLDDIEPSSRKYPAIILTSEREAGDQILHINNMSKSLDSELLFSNLNLNVNKGDKIALISRNDKATTAFYEILNGNIKTR